MPGNKRARYDWNDVDAFFRAGHGRDQCAERFGFTIGAWYKAIRRGRLSARSNRKTVDWPAVQRHYDAGNSARRCQEQFGFTSLSWTKAVRRGAIVTRPLAKPLHEILQSSCFRSTIKRRLLAAGVLRNRCDECGLSEWRGKPLSIQIDHINGVGTDHRVENLRMLCPNCHSQTATFGARNRRQLFSKHKT